MPRDDDPSRLRRTPPAGSPIIERRRPSPHTDFATRETTRPGPHIRRPSPDAVLSEADALAVTIDEGEHAHTPVEGIAIRLRAAIEEHAPPPQWAVDIIDAIVVEVSQRSAEQRARELAAGDALPRRVRELEATVAEHEAKHLRLTGANEGNGRVGTLARDVAELRKDVGTGEDAAANRATAKTVRSISRRLVASLVAAAGALGGTGYVLLGRHDSSTAAAARLELRLEQCESANRATSQRLDGLFSIFAPPRNPS